MSQKIEAQPLAPHEWAVDVTEGTTRTRHRVVVPDELLDNLGLTGADEQRVVKESISLALDRQPATSLYDEFPLDTLVGRFPDFAGELRTRLAS